MRFSSHLLCKILCLVSIYPADNAICGSHRIWSLSLAQAVSRQHHTPHFYCFQIQVIQRVRQARPRPKRPNSVHLEYSIHDKELGSFLLRHRIKKSIRIYSILKNFHSGERIQKVALMRSLKYLKCLLSLMPPNVYRKI